MENVNPIKYRGIFYRVYEYAGAWFWETRKWFIWSRYPHACYESYVDAQKAAKNMIDAVIRGERIF